MKPQKILVLSKRRPQNKDLFTRPYGRFYFLPKTLADRGHKITILLLDYKNTPKIDKKINNIDWKSISIFPFPFLGYYKEAEKILSNNKFDWIFGYSDIYYGIAAASLSKKYKTKCLIDAYDNYESYIPWLYPLHWAWRNSLKISDLITVAGPQLANLFVSYGIKSPSQIIPMSADPEFKPLNKIECRKKLNLPENKFLIGYCGGLYKNRGIELLFKIINHYKNENEIEFIISGRLQRGIPKPKHSTWLGYISDSDMPILVNSLDVMLVFNKHSNFGTYSYPVKIYESIACNVPVVAGKTKSVAWILKDINTMLCKVGSLESYVKKIDYINNTKYQFQSTSDWGTSCDLLENAMHER